MNQPAINLLTALSLLLILTTATAQKKDKQWTDWSKKEAEKVLNDSPWAQTQTDTDTSQMFYSPTSHGGSTSEQASVNGDRAATGATNTAVNVKFHVRFFSARPIRQALARIMILERTPPAEVLTKLHNFADLKSSDSIIVTVTYESPDQRYSNTVMQAFNSAITATLKNDTYLERNDGKRIFLTEYVPPGKDGFGARFIFMRELDGQPFIPPDIREIRFYAQYPDGIKVNQRFKVPNMLYEGALEY